MVVDLKDKHKLNNGLIDTLTKQTYNLANTCVKFDMFNKEMKTKATVEDTTAMNRHMKTLAGKNYVEGAVAGVTTELTTLTSKVS
jgi:ribosomal protein L21